jgi:hemophore-related protein
MLVSARCGRRMLVGALSIGAASGAALVGAPPALADTAPNCSAADRAGINAGVQAATSAYLFTHPDVNAFMTGLAGQPVDQIPSAVRDYLDANPQTKGEIQGIRQPLVDMRNRCGAPLLDQP